MKMRLAVFVSLCVLAATSAFAQMAVTATSGFSFQVSALDQSVDSIGPVVGGYRVNFIPAQGCPAYGNVFLGKPTPDATGTVTIDPFPAFATLPANCAYTLTVTAVGQGPASATSDPLGPFERFVTITPPPPPPPPPAGQGKMLTLADFGDVHTGCRVYRAPLYGEASLSTFYPHDYYNRDDGSRYLMELTGDGHVVDFPDIPGVPCDTPLALIPTAPYGTDYGTMDNIHSSTEQVPPRSSNAMYAGLVIDRDLRPRRFTAGTVGIYVSAFLENNQFTFEFDPVAGTKTLKKCWGLVGKSMTLDGGGGGHIPLYFQKANLTEGVDHFVGSSGPNGGVNAGTSLGMVAFANAMPPDNPCAVLTPAELAARTPEQIKTGVVAVDYLTGPGTTLVLHEPNGKVNPANNDYLGPTCAGSDADGVPRVGCVVTGVASSPYPQRIPDFAASASMYTPTWDRAVYPPDGKTYNYIGPISGGASLSWYVGRPAADGSHKESALSVYGHTRGWINTKIAANPPPTYVNDGSFYGTGTATLVDGCAHDGDCSKSHPYPGFTMWLETGDPAAPGADTANMRNYGCAWVDAYDVATKLLTFHWDSFCGPPMGANSYVPMINGAAIGGCVYAHGMPGCWNYESGIELINPIEFAQVAQGTKDPSTVGYDEAFPLARWMPQFGTTTDGGGQVQNIVGPAIPDGDRNEVLFPVSAPMLGFYGESHLIYVISMKP